MSQIKSMTGYGKGVIEINNKVITVEVKTLNSKQLDISLRVPSAYRGSEIGIRSIINKKLIRGKCDVFVNVVKASSSNLPIINRDLFIQYYNQFKDLAISLNTDCSFDSMVSQIMRFPDVLSQENEEASEEEINAITEAANIAIDNTNNFREQEGAVLIKDILYRIGKIEDLKNVISESDKDRIDVIKAKIKENLDNLNINIDNNRFEQELIYYLEKLDITEEKVRLQNHIDYFKEVVDNDEQPGKKLGFIAQEIGREINTTGSKANNSDIQRMVVMMKDELEKIKEQLLNIL